HRLLRLGSRRPGALAAHDQGEDDRKTDPRGSSQSLPKTRLKHTKLPTKLYFPRNITWVYLCATLQTPGRICPRIVGSGRCLTKNWRGKSRTRSSRPGSCPPGKTIEGRPEGIRTAGPPFNGASRKRCGEQATWSP